MAFGAIKFGEKEMVDAIEDGRVVRVGADYAKKEGLLVLRKVEKASNVPQSPNSESNRQSYREKRSLMNFEPFRKPLKTDKNDIVASLVDNFHWILLRKRKEKNLSRKQLAESLNAGEEDIKMIENGILPSRDYILVSKLENYFRISLRRDSQSRASSVMSERKNDVVQKSEKSSEGKEEDLDLFGRDIEIIKED